MKQLDLFDSLAKDGKAKKEKKAAYDKGRKAYREAYREANKEEIAAYNKAYYQANKEKIAAYYKVYNATNKDKRRTNHKAYKEANKAAIVAQRKGYYQANKNIFRACDSRRRALKQKLIPIHLRDCPQEKQRLLQTYKLSIILTQATGVQHHVDHMWPLNDGGPHWSGNLQVITAQENHSKHASVCEATKSTIIKSLESFQSERTI